MKGKTNEYRKNVTNILKEQQKQVKEALRGKDSTDNRMLFELIHPDNYDKFATSFDNGDEIIVFVGFNKEFWARLTIENILKLMKTRSGKFNGGYVQEILDLFSEEEFKSFFKNGQFLQEIQKIFFAVDRKHKERILKIASTEVINGLILDEHFMVPERKRIFVYSINETLYESESTVENRAEIPKKLAHCEDSKVAWIFEWADAKVVQSMMPFIEKDRYESIFSYVREENRFIVLDNSGWKLLLESDNPESFLGTDDVRIYQELHEDNLMKICRKNPKVLTTFYKVVSRKEKQRILQFFLEADVTKNSRFERYFSGLYENLDVNERRDLLEILASGEHDDFPDYNEEMWSQLCTSAISVLENKELDFYEVLALEELKDQII